MKKEQYQKLMLIKQSRTDYYQRKFDNNAKKENLFLNMEKT